MFSKDLVKIILYTLSKIQKLNLTLETKKRIKNLASIQFETISMTDQICTSALKAKIAGELFQIGQIGILQTLVTLQRKFPGDNYLWDLNSRQQ